MLGARKIDKKLKQTKLKDVWKNLLLEKIYNFDQIKMISKEYYYCMGFDFEISFLLENYFYVSVSSHT